MPAEKTRADSLREYLTGADSDGAEQFDPVASLGGYRASDLAKSFDIVVTSAISGITIDFAGGGNIPGAGTLEAVDANTLQWKCLGESFGTSVPIYNGETKIVETASLPGAFLRVTRTSSANLSGSATVTLTERMNNVFGFDDVLSTEADAGMTEYRATILVNESVATVGAVKRWIGTLAASKTSDSAQLTESGAGTIETSGSFSGWPESGFCHIVNNAAETREIVYYSSRTDTELSVPASGRALLGTAASAGSSTDTIHPVPGIAIAIDDNGVTAGGAAIQTIGDEITPPTGLTWNTAISPETGLQIGDIESGQQVGFWMKREIPPGAMATTKAAVLILNSFDAA